MVKTPPKLFNTASWLNPIMKANTLEHIIRWPVVFAIIVLYQSLFIERAIRIPDKLDRVFKQSALARLIGLWLIALSGTQDFESAFLAAIIFLVTIWLFKSKKERERDGFWGLNRQPLVVVTTGQKKSD
jgi:hypothetical protein